MDLEEEEALEVNLEEVVVEEWKEEVEEEEKVDEKGVEEQKEGIKAVEE